MLNSWGRQRRPENPRVVVSCEGDQLVSSVEWPDPKGISVEETTSMAHSLVCCLFMLSAGSPQARVMLQSALGHAIHMTGDQAFGEYVLKGLNRALASYDAMEAGVGAGPDGTAPAVRPTEVLKPFRGGPS